MEPESPHTQRTLVPRPNPTVTYHEYARANEACNQQGTSEPVVRTREISYSHRVADRSGPVKNRIERLSTRPYWNPIG